jgi:hydroxymethylpyrimidine/phosphomethylpyrimidine kinase
VPAALRELLLPHATLVTPNTEEAGVLLGCRPATDVAGQTRQARALRESTGCRAVVVTGGVVTCRDGTDRVDVLVDASGSHVLRSPELPTRNDHGTGCTFASAAAAHLARGADVPDAVGSARAFVRRALLASAAWRLGAGRGPVAHTTTHPHPSTTQRGARP